MKEEILFVLKDKKQKIPGFKKNDNYRIKKMDLTENYIEQIEKKEINIVFISSIEACKNIRKYYYNSPLQVILIINKNEKKGIEVDEAIESGDDIIHSPITKKELSLKIAVAKIRLERQLTVFSERDFYRNAVKQEEELTSKILDKTLYLKEAFQNIEMLNKELERTNKQLKRIAKFDNLSNLLNRMSLFALLDIEIERSIRTGAPLSGIMMDVDHFKLINDNYGHQCGDEVIKCIGNFFRKFLRKYDNAGRYGGEEFFIILPNTNKKQAEKIGERFRREISEMDIIHGESSFKITASFGIAEFRTGYSRDIWLAKADKAMYRAKQLGRNRVVA